MKKFSSFIAIMLLSFYSAMAQTTATINTETNLITSVDQFSSPYTESIEGSVEALFDNDPSTFWHSVWSSGRVDNGVHYFQTEVASLPNEFAFSFTRRGVSNDQISRWSVYGVPENNTDATKMKCALLAEVETPVGSSGETCISPVISSQGFTTIRFYEEATSNSRGYFHLAEFAIHPTETSEISPLVNSVYVSQLESQAGMQLILPIQMKSTIEPTGFQADLVLPEGITVAEDEDGLPLVALSTERTTAIRTNVFDCNYQADGSLRILCNSTKGIAFSDYDGEVALVTLNISEELTAGDYPITLKNIVITDAQGAYKKKVEATESVLKIVSSTEEGGDSEPDSWECTHIRGDVNGDGEVTIEDVNEVIDILLKKKNNVHEYVDLGLSVKWATCNVGADNPEDYGDYYAWGETETKSTYDWSTYKWCNGSSTTMTKYCTSSSYGTVDNKTTLDPEDDVAHVKWGGDWRMPTKAEQDELRDTNNCTWTWTTQGGKNGYKVTSKKNGNSIFLPASGYRYDSSLYNAGSSGDYWSSSLDTSSSDIAYYLYFNSSGVNSYGLNRYYGFAVRPVCP